MATFHCFAAVLCISLGLFVITAAQTPGNETDFDYEFGNSTDGNSTEFGLVCSELNCQGQGSLCIESNDTAYCTCHEGFRLRSDMRTCESCPGGTYGVGCLRSCDCGDGGNTCDKVNGSCICNTCYSGTNCQMGEGFECFVQFLGIPNKESDSLMEIFGTTGYPQVPQMYTEELIASLAGISPIDRGIVSVVTFETVSRVDVNQGPLIAFKATLDKTQGLNAVNDAITTLQNKVKVGEIAATLIIQDSTTSTTAEVTINAGVKNEN